MAERGTSFADLLRAYRAEARLTQEALAARAGLSLDAVGMLERGVRHQPRRIMVELLADPLRLTPPQREALIASARSQAASLSQGPFRRQNPGSEPSAVVPHAGICAGAAREGGPYRGHGRAGLVEMVSSFDMYEGFKRFDVATGGTTIHGRRGGDGPPVLLLHGIPETHLMWHRVAPRLAERLTVVAADLRGFGDSGTPPSAPDHAPYSMREVARDQVELMRVLGYERFAVAGHDRGARCAYRMALDHPDVVTKLAVLDIVPTADAFARADARFALGFWVWSFLAAAEPVPERLVAAAPDVLVNHMLNTWSNDPGAFSSDVRAEYAAKLGRPAAIHAICEQYRAAATLDREHDEADRGARRITCPVLALWAEAGPVGAWYDALALWREWADDVRGGPIAAGHFLPEEAPDETTRRLIEFFAGG